MYFIKRNIYDFWKNHKDVFLIFLLLQIVSVFSIFFLYGLLVNYQKESEDMSFDTYEISTSINLQPAAPLRTALAAILENMGDKIDAFSVLGFYGDYNVGSYNNLSDGKYIGAGFLGTKSVTEGRLPALEDFEPGAATAWGNYHFHAGDPVTLGDTTYTVAGIDASLPTASAPFLHIPFPSLPDETEVIGLYLHFSKHPTESDYAFIKQIMADTYGESASPEELYLDKPSRKKALASMNLVAVIIGIISSMNICIIYSYLIDRRRKKNAVIQICGMSYRTMCLYLYVEILVLTAATYLLGFFCFKLMQLTVFNHIFLYFSTAFPLTSIGKLTVLYFIITSVCTVLLSVLKNKREPVQLLRRSYYA